MKKSEFFKIPSFFKIGICQSCHFGVKKAVENRASQGINIEYGTVLLEGYLKLT